MIDVTCPMCGEVYHADPVHTGRHIQSRRCGTRVPILAASGTIVQQTPGTPEVGQPSPRVTQPRTAPPSRRKNSWIFGSAVAVAVIAGGLVSLLWYYNTDTDVAVISGGGRAESHDSSHAGAATPEPAATPDHFEVLDKGPQKQERMPLPCDEQPPSKHHSLPNGTPIVPDSATSGHGVLEVQNGTREDAVLSLYDPAADESIREVYVQAKHSVRMNGIPKGTYELAYTRGLDWDADQVIFRCGDPDYAQFDREFAFTEKEDQQSIQYKTITLTLHSVFGGNIRTKRISREAFLKGNRKTHAQIR
jgi:hypothetical protein